MIPIDWLLKYWQAGLIVALLAFGGTEWTLHNRAEVEKGKAIERAHVADSTLAAVKPVLQRTDTAIVHDTVTLTKALKITAILHDTVIQHLTDTVLVKQYIERSDSALKACTSLVNDCAAFRQAANTTIQALQAKLVVAGLVKPRSCIGPQVLSGILGLGAGYLVHR